MLSQSSNSPVALICRIFWLMAGPFLLLLFTYFIIAESAGWATLIDFGFFLVVAGMIFARWVELAQRNATNAYGEPVTREELWRYTIAVALCGLVIWLLANILGNHVLSGQVL